MYQTLVWLGGSNQTDGQIWYLADMGVDPKRSCPHQVECGEHVHWHVLTMVVVGSNVTTT